MWLFLWFAFSDSGPPPDPEVKWRYVEPVITIRIEE